MREPLRYIKPHFKCLEIGVWKGEFSVEILKKQPKELHLIDPWLFQTEFGNKWYGGMIAKNQKDMDEIYKLVSNKFENNKNVKIHRGYSDKLADKFENGFFDWIYIDGNHEYEYVKNDLEKYYPKLVKGGYLTGDDYLWKNDSNDLCVKRAVDEFVTQRNLKLKTYKNQFIIHAV